MIHSKPPAGMNGTAAEIYAVILGGFSTTCPEADQPLGPAQGEPPTSSEPPVAIEIKRLPMNFKISEELAADMPWGPAPYEGEEDD